MAAFRFSRRAATDLLNITTYTLRTWGKAQAARYIDGLELCCENLADNPELGRRCDEIRSHLRCLEYVGHLYLRDCVDANGDSTPTYSASQPPQPPRFESLGQRYPVSSTARPTYPETWHSASKKPLA